ncbi:TolC family protein [Zunongwangia profunda]|uniref:TolC family protein n=1 Tax=Zunongwangia profunda TaxID=398743 RepID=UPI001D195B3C|nr:TolC family protein [Zunongwangia profunda]MCC4230713.1 TolC family protein [Zunongwangia profunda]|tara:strand:- start:404 stop:1732 length:1329 start_codon:yes stop_codon:yes gene_type:complete
MKSKSLLLVCCLFFGFQSFSQENKTLSLKEAVSIALNNSDDAKLAETTIKTATEELKVTKNNQYPEFSLSGQYQYLTSPNIDLQLAIASAEPANGETGGSVSPDINQIMLGQASISMPIFSGFKLKNAVHASLNNFEATSLEATSTKERIALQTISTYLNLYKAQQMVAAVKENLKSAHQRVKDFSAMEQNGLLARNDLLKAQLQESNINLTLQEAQKNVSILNYRLATFLKLPDNFTFKLPEETIGVTPTVERISIQRADLEALDYRQKASENSIKMAKAAYYPSIALIGGYAALDIQNALTVTNAVNIGVGVSYDISKIFKAKNDVKLAQHKAEELQYNIAKAKDDVKIQVKNAKEEYQLALTQFEVYSQSQEQAEENYRIVKDKYDNGLVDTNDLLEADVEQLQSKINKTNARADISLKYYQLLQAEGHLTNKFNFKNN